MRTKHKIFVARQLSRLLRAGRSLCGLRNVTISRRSALRWELDLCEGIDLHIFLFGSFEPAIFALAAKVVPKDGTIVDIGANIGAHTLRFAQLVGENGLVYAFEPTDYAFAKLKRNISLNPDIAPRIQAMQILLASSVDQAKPSGICSSWPLNSAKNVHQVHMGEAKSLQNAQVVTLDQVAQQIGWRKIDLIKLDVDGNELFVLQGGQKLLKEKHPPVVMEFAPYIYTEFGYSFSDLVGYLRSHSYQCQLLPSRKRVEFDQLPEMIGDGASINVLLV
jgi:FkbM family methyltransferase